MDTLPDSAQSEQNKSTAFCFSLEREQIGLGMESHNFSEDTPKDRLLTFLSQNVDGTWLKLATLGQMRTDIDIWNGGKRNPLNITNTCFNIEWANEKPSS